MSADHLLRLSKVAELLGGINPRGVRRLIAAGELAKPVKVRGISCLFESDIEAYKQRLKKTREDKS